jgi:hypothetical protein
MRKPSVCLAKLCLIYRLTYSRSAANHNCASECTPNPPFPGKALSKFWYARRKGSWGTEASRSHLCRKLRRKLCRSGLPPILKTEDRKPTKFPTKLGTKVKEIFFGFAVQRVRVSLEGPLGFRSTPGLWFRWVEGGGPKISRNIVNVRELARTNVNDCECRCTGTG